MALKKWNFDRFLSNSIAIFCVASLVVASVVIMNKQQLPSRTLAFVRSLAGNDDVLASDKSESDIDSKFDYEEIRLPGDVFPKAYDLSIAVNLSTLTFSGDVEITVFCEHSTNRIVLHAKDMNILRTNVSNVKTGKDVKVEKVSTKSQYDHYIIELDKELKKHRHYVIKMNYEANISKTLDGFYKSYYTTELGERR